MVVGAWPAWVLCAAAAISLTAWCWQAVTGWWKHRTAPPPPPVTLLLVTKDQEAGIEGFLRRLFRCARSSRRCRLSEVIVVDKKSSDDTPAIVRRLSRRFPLLRVVRWLPVRGRDEKREAQSALELGAFLATADITVMMTLDQPADLQHQLESLTALLAAPFRDAYDEDTPDLSHEKRGKIYFA